MVTRWAGQPNGEDGDGDGDGDQSDVYMSTVRQTNDVRTSKSEICCELGESGWTKNGGSEGSDI